MTLALVTTLVALLAIAGLAGFAARRVGVPYPVLLVLVGLALALIPGLPHLAIAPDLILFVFLPPLVYRGAFHAPLREFVETRRTLLALAVPGLVATALLVALPAHHLAGLPWAAALTLGAILAPTDPIAALAIFRTLGAPPRLAALVEGESLLNDGTGLVVYRIVVAVAVTGHFSPGHALGEFLLVAGGGIAVGLAVGWIAFRVLRVVDDPQAEATLHLAVAYGGYVLAERLEVSGVLATVVAGLLLGGRFGVYSGAATRLVGVATWDVLEFIANSLLFLIVGLQLRTVLGTVVPVSAREAIIASLVTVGGVVAARSAVTFGGNLLARLVHRVRRRHATPLPPSWAAVLAASGLRGGLTLALALALPATTDTGAPFPARDLLQLLTFVAVICTLVPPAFLLPPMLRRLGLAGDRQEAIEEQKARRGAAAAARDLLAAMEGGELQGDARQRLGHYYDVQVDRFARLLPDGDAAGEGAYRGMREVQLRLLEAERQAVERLVREREISSAVAARVRRDIDLEVERLTVTGGGGG